MKTPSPRWDEADPRRPARERKTPSIRVLIVGASRLMADAWAAVVGSAKGIRVTGSCVQVEEAIPLIPECDVVLVLPAPHIEAGAEKVRSLTQADPQSRIVVAGIPPHEQVILAFVEAGASAYVSEDETAEAVLSSLRGALRGEAYVDPEVAPVLIEHLTRLRQASVGPETFGARLEALTPRERQVLELIGRNQSNREIADHLLIELGTVKNHVHNVLEKLSMESRRQAAACLHAIPMLEEADEAGAPGDLPRPSPPEREESQEGREAHTPFAGIDPQGAPEAAASTSVGPRGPAPRRMKTNGNGSAHISQPPGRTSLRGARGSLRGNHGPRAMAQGRSLDGE